VNQSYKITQKQIQLRDLETELKALTEDSNSLSTQISYTKDLVANGQLKREQLELFKKMNQVAAQCDQLWQEIWDELSTPELTDLCSILKSIELKDKNKGIINQVCQSVLPELSEKSARLEGLLLQIADLPSELDEPKALQRFINELIGTQSLDTKHKNKLKAWAKKQRMTINTATVVPATEMEICLMIKVSPHPPSKYLVSAAVVWNPDPWRTEKSLLEASSIDLPPIFNTGCPKEQLSDILGELLATCAVEHSIALAHLTVQWFLPCELMGLDVEHWPILIGDQRPPNGVRCKAVMVRNADRHFSEKYKLVKGDWQAHWKRISPASHCHSALDPLDSVANNNWQPSTAIGCHFVEHQDLDQQEIFWDCLIGQGLPIALWSRRSGATKRKAQGVIKSVTNCSVAELPRSLHQRRKKVLPQIPAVSAPAAHLSLLWDNPFLPYPIVDYRSK
jgi:vWA-MoxR associated protein C-terminal domain/Effector-associated domain 9/vWA-MoxR associated protein middle region (VMAP-M) 1